MAKSFIITGIDIGSEKIKILVVQKQGIEPSVEVLAQIEERSFGVRKGVVVNANQVSDQIKYLIGKLEERIDHKIESAYINVNGNHISPLFSSGEIAVSRADRKISKEDIERVIESSKAIDFPPNREILESFVSEFIIDKEAGIKDPLGMSGIRLEVKIFLLLGFTPYLKNLTKAVLDSGVQIADIQVSSLCSSEAVLTQRQKELGVALIDIGAETTGLSVYEEGDLIHNIIFPIGSSNITKDIAVSFKYDFNIAERIKREFGSCLVEEKSNKKDSDNVKIFSEGKSMSFSKKELNNIIEERVSEIFEQVNKELKKISRQKLLPGGIVLTGGGSKIPKIVELAKRELELPAKKGKLPSFSGIKENSEWAVACGLVLAGINQLEDNGGSEGPIPPFVKRIFSRIKRMFRIFIP